MAKLSAWVKKHLGSKQSPKKQSADQPPYLPLPRRPITPTSSDPTGSHCGVNIQKQPPSCLFFSQLPDDIRRAILFTGFGGRTLHMDINFGFPRFPPPSSDHGCLAERCQNEVWQWRGAVCYQNDSRLPSTGRAMRYAWHGPWNDECLRSIYSKENWSEEYNTGIMGFLLSCRQAYTEGIEVLYSANCITIQSEPLLMYLPRLIPPNRLVSIKSLEIVITAHSIGQGDARVSFTLNHLKPILDNIAKHCPLLRSLCLSFLVASQGHEILLGPALPLVDEFYQSMSLRDLRVELPCHAYRACDVRSMEDHPLEEPAKGPFERSLWRSLDGNGPEVQSRSVENYPNPPLKLPMLNDGNESASSAGYWLSEGDTGPMRPYVQCF